MRSLLRAVRDGQVLGSGIADAVQSVLPRGLLSGWQFAAALLVGLLATGNYGWADRRRDPGRLFVASALASALTMWTLIWRAGFSDVALQYLLTTLMVWIGLVLERLAVDNLARPILVAEHHVLPTLMVGPADECRVAMKSPAFAGSFEYSVVGFADTARPPAPDSQGHASEFGRLLASHNAEAIVVCGYLPDNMFHDVIDAALASGCQIFSVPRAITLAGVQPSVTFRNRAPLIELSRPALRGYQMVLKRTLDLFGATIGLVILAPVFAMIALAVKLESRGAAFFGHRRLGLNGRSFNCYKFRSMHEDAERRLRRDPELYAEYVAGNYKLPSDRDPRLTRVGRILRQTSLDELPQLLNVLLGAMSLVGPRPIVPEELDEYGHGAAAFLSLKPGMTGAWQVGGRSKLGYPARADIELEYVRNWSLGRDLWILLRTIPVVLARRGAH